MTDWDSEDFDPDAGFQKAAATDRWEGEDEDDGVKDAWDDEDEEGNKDGKDENENGETATGTKAVQVKKKKKSNIEEAVRKKEEKRKEKLQQLKQQEEESKNLTAEELEQLQKDADLELTKEMFAAEAPLAEDSLDALNPQTKEQFDRFAMLLKKKLTTLESSPFYIDFLEDVMKDCCINLDTEYARRIGNSITAIATEKQKAEKAAVKSKKKSKKGVLVGSNKAGKRDELDAYDDMEDFI